MRAVSSENDTTPEALVVPDRKSGKRKAKSWLILNTVTVAPGTLRVSVSWKRTAARRNRLREAQKSCHYNNAQTNTLRR